MKNTIGNIFLVLLGLFVLFLALDFLTRPISHLKPSEAAEIDSLTLLRAHLHNQNMILLQIKTKDSLNNVRIYAVIDSLMKLPAKNLTIYTNAENRLTRASASALVKESDSIFAANGIPIR